MIRIKLSPIKPNDIPFLKEVYKSTRLAELDNMSCSEEMKENFIEFQFNAQQAHYSSAYKGADFSIIQYKQMRIGRVYIWETDEQIRLIDISILPNFTNKGIGSRIINDLIYKSEMSGKVLNLHVEQHNIARKLYERLGFKYVEDKGAYLYMEYIPK